MNPTIYIFSSVSSLALKIADRFISKGFPVSIVSFQADKWSKVSLPVGVSVTPFSAVNFPLITHALVIDLDGKEFVPSINSGKLSFPGKAVLITSVYASVNLKAQTLPIKLCVIGDTLDLSSQTPLPQMLVSLATKNEINIPPENTTVYPVLMEDVLDRLERALFSYGQEATFVAFPMILSNWVEMLRGFAPSAQIKFKAKPFPPVSLLPSPVPVRVMGEDIKKLLESMSAKEIALKPVPVTKPRKKLTIKRPKLPKKLGQKILMSILILTWIVLFPFIPLAASAGGYYGAYKLFINNQDNGFLSLLNFAGKNAHLSEKVLNLYTKVPLFGQIYKVPYSVSQILETGSSIANDALAIRGDIKTLSHGILGSSHYNLKDTSDSLAREINSLYIKLAFLETALKDSLPSVSVMIPEVDKLPAARHTLSGLKEVARNLPTILGSEGPATYLVLLQNNMELRPTGGFIGSFTLVTFENGKLIDTSVYDVYDADGQLKGYIKPPEPIVNHLGEASWFMRDSNWDPDFVISAERAEWFLDKSIDRQVKGVIAIDLEVAKTILLASGPVILPDFNDKISADNMYEKIQYEVEESFFPGSRKKTNYLTALANALIEKAKHLPESSYQELTKGLWQNILARDIQIALHDSDAHEGLKVLGWTGEMPSTSCPGDCAAFPVGLVEANVGVNKANYHVSRQAALQLYLQNTTIKSILNLEIKNTSPQVDREIEHRYKTYLRVIAPLESKVESVTISSQGKKEKVTPDIKIFKDHIEIGMLVEVLPLKTSNIEVHWATPSNFSFTSPESLQVTWRKQAGVPGHPILLSYSLPSSIKVSSDPPIALTLGGNLGYNTTLSRDFVQTLSW